MAAAHVSSTYALNETSCHYNVRLIRPLHTRTVPAAELDRSHDHDGPCSFRDQDPPSRTNQYQAVEVSSVCCYVSRVMCNFESESRLQNLTAVMTTTAPALSVIKTRQAVQTII